MKILVKKLNFDRQGESPSWILAFICIVFAFVCFYTGYHGIIKWPNGDEGIYLSGGYHLANGQTPHVDYWWPQGIGVNFLVAFWGKIFGFNLLSMRFLSSFSLVFF